MQPSRTCSMTAERKRLILNDLKWDEVIEKYFPFKEVGSSLSLFDVCSLF